MILSIAFNFSAYVVKKNIVDVISNSKHIAWFRYICLHCIYTIWYMFNSDKGMFTIKPEIRMN